jgi:hypothetical protein
MDSRARCVGIAIALTVVGLPGATRAMAQSPAPGAGTPSVETDPMNCWWRTDKSAVRVGEPFELTLTCRVMETPAVTVVPTLTEIEPASIELTPFEILQGTRHQDIVAPPWRYLQFEYTVRLLGDEFFGQDVPIPATNVAYRIQTRSQETVEGNEQRYVLPPMPIRVLSLVPAQAADIRNPAIDTFGDLEARRFRAATEQVASAILFGFAAVLAVIAGFRVRERFHKAGPAVEQTASVPAVLGGCVREVERVRAEALREGWTSHLAGQAIAPFRVAGAIALKQPVAQTKVTNGTLAREGQVALRHGWPRRQHAIVSASITAEAIDRLRTSGNGHRPAGADQDALDRIQEALMALNVVRYGRESAVDAHALDQVVDAGGKALRRLRTARLWPSRAAGAVTQSATVFIESWRR